MTVALQEPAVAADLKPLGNVSVGELPVPFRDLLNAPKPLTAEHFAPRIIAAPFWALLLIPCMPFAVGSIGLLNGAESAADAARALIFVVPLVLILALMSLLAVRRERYRRRVRSGELRLGVFVHRDALLIRTKEDTCFLLPRTFVRAVIFEKYLHWKHTHATRLIFVDADGNRYLDIIGRNAFGIADRFEHYQNLAHALRRWKPELEIVEKR
jgi:hypothetical protein